METYDRLLLALEHLLEEVQQVADNTSVREWAWLATLDAIDLGERLGMLWDDEAEWRRATVKEAFGDLDRQ